MSELTKLTISAYAQSHTWHFNLLSQKFYLKKSNGNLYGFSAAVTVFVPR